MEPTSALLFLASALACTLLAFGVRSAMWRMLRNSNSRAGAELPAIIDSEPLRPAELAYLERDGDTVHTMVVLVVDLVQRIVKAGEETPLVLQPYETVIFSSVKDFVRKWAHGKLSEVIPVHDIRNPMQWFTRIRAIKAFFGNTLRGFFKDLIKDPLHIRKYFSWSGIVRFALALCTTGARQGVEESMRSTLLGRGLLVRPETNKKFAALSLLLIPLMVACAWGIRAMFFPDSQITTFIALMVMGMVNAAGVRAVLALPSLIPSYDEFNRIAAELPREGRRMLFVKTILRFSRVLIIWLTLLTTIILLAVEFAVDHFLLHAPPGQAMAIVFSATMMSLPMVQALLDWHALSTRDHASRLALQQVHEQRQSLRNVSPVGSLRSMLSDPQYEPEFSKILAIYGIETLWLLG